MALGLFQPFLVLQLIERCCAGAGQVQGLHSEYERLRLESEGGKSASRAAAGDEAGRLQASLQAAQREKEQMQQELTAAQKARRTAEANVEALRSQTKARAGIACRISRAQWLWRNCLSWCMCAVACLMCWLC
jgi:hypothetical protein